jgi:hypothetical protein
MICLGIHRVAVVECHEDSAISNPPNHYAPAYSLDGGGLVLAAEKPVILGRSANDPHRHVVLVFVANRNTRFGQRHDPTVGSRPCTVRCGLATCDQPKIQPSRRVLQFDGSGSAGY